MKKPKSTLIRAALELGKTQAEICKRLNVSPQQVRDAKRRSATRGRPRVHTHPAEAVAKYLDFEARHLEDSFRDLTELYAQRIRSGAWRKFL